MVADSDKQRDGENGGEALNADEEQVEETDGVFTKVRLRNRARNYGVPRHPHRRLHRALWVHTMDMNCPGFTLPD